MNNDTSETQGGSDADMDDGCICAPGLTANPDCDAHRGQIEASTAAQEAYVAGFEDGKVIPMAPLPAPSRQDAGGARSEGDAMTPQQYDRLPKYGRDEIVRLQQEMARLSYEVDQFNGDADSPISVSRGFDPARPIPDGTVRFALGSGYSNRIDLRIQDGKLDVNGGRDLLDNGMIVITAWLGHDPTGIEPPHIFHSLVYGEGETYRFTRIDYATEAQAREGHAELVAKWQGG